MIFALSGIATKALLPSGDKKVNKDKLIPKDKGSTTNRVSKKDVQESEGQPKSLVVRKKISTSSFLSSPNIPELPKKSDLNNGKSNISKIFERINKTLFFIANAIRNKNNQKKVKIKEDLKQKNKLEKKNRESNIEKRIGEKQKEKINLPGDTFNIGRYFKNIIIGSIVLAIFKNLQGIVSFFKGIYDRVKSFIQKLVEFITPIWNALKWIVGGGIKIIGKILRFFNIGSQESEDEKYSKKIKNEMNKIDEFLRGIYNFFNMEYDGLDDSYDSDSPLGIIIKDDAQALKELGLTQEEWNAYKQGIANVELANYDQMGGAGNQFAGRYQMGDAAITDAAKILGIKKPTRKEFLSNPELQERMYLGYTVSNYRALKSQSPEFRDMSQEEKISTLSMSQLGVGNMLRQIRTGAITKDQFGTPSTRFAESVRRELEDLHNTPSSPPPPSPSSSSSGRMVIFGGNTYYQKPDGITLSHPSAAPPEIRSQPPVSIDSRQSLNLDKQPGTSIASEISQTAYYESLSRQNSIIMLPSPNIPQTPITGVASNIEFKLPPNYGVNSLDIALQAQLYTRG